MPANSTERSPKKVVQFGAGTQTEWLNENNAMIPDSQFAQVDLPTSNGFIPFPGSYYLIAKEFEFHTGPNAIPITATKILGIQVKFHVFASPGGAVISNVVQLTKNGKGGVRRNKGNSVVLWPSAAEGDLTYGGERDRWREPGGVKVPLKPDAIRKPEFGVILQVQNCGGAAVSAYLDSIQMTVWHE